MEFSPAPLLADAGANSAIIAFAIYMAVVMVLAWLSNVLRQSKSFLSEYFLGSRSLGMWAFALTFAATSSSGGSFIGFPSLVYTHGWIVSLWIGSYMIVPIVSMGLLAKRINQLARKTGAITIPDVMRDRFESPTLGLLATVLIVFFMSFNLIAQFKGGSVILNTLLEDVPLFAAAKDLVAPILVKIPLLSGAADRPGYLICLFVFTATVVVYTSYGGFRAVVWTDVMQGFVMVAGVIILFPLALWSVGGLGSVTEKMSEMTPPRFAELRLSTPSPAETAVAIPANTWLVVDGTSEQSRQVFRTSRHAVFAAGETQAKRPIERAGEDPTLISAIELTYGPHIDDAQPTSLPLDVRVEPVSSREYARGADQPGVYVTGPGPHASSNAGFLPLGLAVSFFFMWTFSGAGQPSNMVRLMAFQNASTLRRAIFTVSIYYSLIYLPLVIVFCCARVLLPGWESEPDRIMPEMAKYITAAINMPWLAGLLVAAPFAAVMSTMDSYLLMISSAVVRDVFQRNVDPTASEKTMKRLTYAVTMAVGAGAMLAAVNPPNFLQDIIVFTGTGLSTSFLAPVLLMLYWPRCNKQGAIAGMLGGFFAHVVLYSIGFYYTGSMEAYQPFDLHPFLIGLIASLVSVVTVTLLTPPPPRHLVRKFFAREG